MTTTILLFTLLKIIVIVFLLLIAVAFSVWFDRKIIARLQSGPARIGPHGLLQPLADAIKLLTKENITPANVSRPSYLLAPALSLVTALLAFAAIPIGPVTEIAGVDLLQIANLDVGVLFILSIISMGFYGIALAGWSSNNQFALLGGLRSLAQTISCQLAMILSLVGVLLLSGSMNLRDIVNAQASTTWGVLPHWNIFPQLIGCFCFFTASLAATHRPPFNVSTESELAGGYRAEYSGMKFAMFFLAEYANLLTIAGMVTLLFLGGWHGPVFGPPLLHTVLPLLWFSLKILALLFLYVWMRATLPRFRYDQLMALGWKFLFPLAAINVVLTSLVVAYRAA